MAGIVGLLLQGAVVPCAYGQAGLRPEPVRFETLSLEAGLSSVRTWDILQDRQGFLWVATGAGLNRYDGHAFTVFESGAPGSLSHHQVFALEEDHAGTLWVGTWSGGLNRFDAATQSFTHYRHDPDDPHSLVDDKIWTVYAPPSEPGVLWVGTYGGLSRLDIRAGTFTSYCHDPGDPQSLPGNTVYGVVEDATGTIWVATSGGLAKVVRRSTGAAAGPLPPGDLAFARYAPADAVLGMDWRATALVQDRTGALWVGVSGKGLVRLDLATDAVTHYRHDSADPESLSGDRVQALMEDRRGRIWVGTYGEGVSVFDPASETFAQYRHEPQDAGSLGYNIVRAVYEDRAGTVWVGTWGEGLSKVRTDKFRTYRHEPGNPASLLPGTVAKVAEDGQGGLWVGMGEGGLTHIGQGGQGGPRAPVYTHFPADRFAPYMQSMLGVMALWPSPSDPEVVWVGMADGLARVDRRTRQITPFRPSDEDRSNRNQIRVLQPSCDVGVVWVGTEEGLYRFQETTQQFTTVEASLAVQTLYSRPEEPCRLWVTVRGGGLFEVRPASRTDGEFVVTPRPARDASGRAGPYALAHLWTSTNDGRLWFSIDRPGLAAYDPATQVAELYDEADGLSVSFVRAALADDEGRLWIGTDRGLVQFDPATGAQWRYDETDGLPSRAFAAWGAVGGENGRLYFGGRKGLTVIEPGRTPVNAVPPPVAFTDLRLNNRSLPIDPEHAEGTLALPAHVSQLERLVLPHDANVLTFAFAALDFTAPARNQYAYRMEGFDAAWQEAGTAHTATYTNLDPGRYVLHVRAANNDGVWNDEGTRLALRILPPWYQTRLAYALYVLLSVSALVGFVQMRERRLRRRAARLEATVAERTEQLQRQQAQLARQKAELEVLDETKSRFFANLSHEFRTPLTLLLGPIDDLLAGRFGRDEARPHLERARHSGQRLLRLINQLLDLARLDAGTLTLTPARHDLARVARQSTAAFASLAQTRGVALTFESEREVLPYACDAECVETIVVNLVSNAIKFTPPGGRITVRLARGAEGAAVLVVEDTGVGIAAEHVGRLFERFYQVDDSPTRSVEGTGIGLALVAQLAAAHGGSVEVASRVGEGTTFTVTLAPLVVPGGAVAGGDGAAAPEDLPEETAKEAPRLEAASLVVERPAEAAAELAAQAATEAAGDGAPGAPGSVEGEPDVDEPGVDEPLVLIVEDNADLRAYLRTHLEGTGTGRFRVVEAADGQAGLEQALALVPDLIVSDVMMPRLDGLGLLAALRADRRTSHIPVVLLTARADERSRLTGLETGAEAYLTKPFSVAELQVRVGALIARQQALRAAFGGRTAASTEAGEMPEVRMGAAREAVQVQETEAAAAATPAEAPQVLTPLDEAFLQEVRATIEHALGDASFGAEQLAEALALSPRQLYRKLAALTGEAPGTLLRTARLERAAELLAAGEAVKEVVDAVGFRSRSSFSKAFKEHAGQTPSAYAKG